MQRFFEDKSWSEIIKDILNESYNFGEEEIKKKKEEGSITLLSMKDTFSF